MKSIVKGCFFFSFICISSLVQSADQSPNLNLPFRTVESLEQSPALLGEGFRTQIFGREVQVNSWDPTSIRAVVFGVQDNQFLEGDAGTAPLAALYYWKHDPKEESILSFTTAIVYNDLFLQHTLANNFDFIIQGTQFFPPTPDRPVINGQSRPEFEITTNWLSLGVGWGQHQFLGGQSFNIESWGAILSYDSYSLSKSSETDTSSKWYKSLVKSLGEYSFKFQYRRDELTRNILGLPQKGWAIGMDLVIPFEVVTTPQGSESLGYQTQFYIVGSQPLRIFGNQTSQLIEAFQFGVVDGDVNPERAFRVGGGSSSLGETFNSTMTPYIPSLMASELKATQYGIAHLEYRYQLLFFNFLRWHLTVGRGNWAELSQAMDNSSQSKNEFIANSLGLVTGFAFGTRLNLDYSVSDVPRQRGHHAQDLTILLSKQF